MAPIQRKIVAVFPLWMHRCPEDWDDKLSSQLIKFTNDAINQGKFVDIMKFIQAQLARKVT